MNRARMLTTVSVLGAAVAAGAGTPLAIQVEVAGTSLVARSAGDCAGITVTVSGPQGVVQREFPGDRTAVMSVLRSGVLADGVYHWEARCAPRLTAEERAARAKDRESSRFPDVAATQGAFRVEGGNVVAPGLAEPQAPRVAGPAPSPSVQVIADNLEVQGSACVGLDCSGAESFGFDTIRLKENNTRIKFEDTSATAGFATHDWQLTANDSASGGPEKFSIEDITAATVPFTLTGSAPSDSLFVTSTGLVGLGTSTPVLHLQITQGDTPATRLEQTSASGFTPQTWDVAGNESNFFVRDVTGGSRLPLRIRPGAPTSSVDIAASGSVGMGTASPSASLHVSRTDGTAQVLVEEASGTAASREMLRLRNNGPAMMLFENTGGGKAWRAGARWSTFVITTDGPNAPLFAVDSPSGNVTLAGTLSQNSDRDTKEDIVAVDPDAILDEVGRLPIATWRKKGDAGVHLGPMAQDFAAAFGLGEDDRHIATIDVGGVALASVQALERRLRQRDAEIADLKARNADMDERLRKLEAALQALSAR